MPKSERPSPTFTLASIAWSQKRIHSLATKAMAIIYAQQ